MVKNGEQAVGNKTRVKVVKNKVAPPFRECEFEITYGIGISAIGEIVDLASEAGLIEKSGAYCSISGERIAKAAIRPASILVNTLSSRTNSARNWSPFTRRRTPGWERPCPSLAERARPRSSTMGDGARRVPWTRTRCCQIHTSSTSTRIR